MDLELYNKEDLKNINDAKEILNDVIEQLRCNITKKPEINKIRFSNFIVGSGKHMIILINPDKRNFDIDCQIIISEKIFKNRFSNNTKFFYDEFKKELEKIFLESGFQPISDSRKALKFYSSNSKYIFRYEIVFCVGNPSDFKEVIVDEGKYILNEPRNYNFLNIFKMANKINRSKLIELYLNARNKKLHLEKTDEHKNDSNFLLLYNACENVINNFS